MIPLLLALACADPAPPTAPPPKAAPETPTLRAEAVGPCWALPLPHASGLQLSEDRALVSARDHDAGMDRYQSWWLDLDTGALEPLGEGLGPLPQLLPDGSAALARPHTPDPARALATRRVGARPEHIAQLVRRVDGEDRPLSAPGHDVTSFLVRAGAGGPELLYAAGRRLWRADPEGGPPSVIAEEVMEVHDLLDERLLVNMVHEDALVLALLSAEGEVTPLGEGVDLARAAEGVVWAQRHPSAPLRRVPVSPTGEPSETPERLLPSGAVVTHADDGPRLRALGGDGEGLRVEGAASLRDAAWRAEQLVALVSHASAGQGAVSPLNEADVCVSPAGGPAAVTPRDVPLRYVQRFADLEPLNAELKVQVERYAVRQAGGYVELTLAGPGPSRPPTMRDLVDRARAAMPAGDAPPDLILRFPASGLFGLAMTRGGRTLHRSGYHDVVLVADASEVPLQVLSWAESEDRCAGQVQNAGDAPLEVTVECVPKRGGWGYLQGPPPETQQALSVAPGAQTDFDVAAGFEGPRTLRFTDDSGPTPFLVREDALAARQLFAALLDLSERRGLQIAPDSGPAWTFTPGAGPWATDSLPGVYADALLIQTPPALFDDPAAMKGFTRDLRVALRTTEGEPMVSVRLADEAGQLYTLKDEAWVPDGRRSALGLGGLQ